MCDTLLTPHMSHQTFSYDQMLASQEPESNSAQDKTSSLVAYLCYNKRDSNAIKPILEKVPKPQMKVEKDADEDTKRCLQPGLEADKALSHLVSREASPDMMSATAEPGTENGSLKRKSSFFGSPVVTIKVGKGNELVTFSVPQDLLLDASPSFLEKLKAIGTSKEGMGSLTYHLPNMSACTFDHILHVINHGELLHFPAALKVVKTSTLIDIYAMGELFGINKVKDAALDELEMDRINNHGVLLVCVKQAYESTSNGSGLRRWFIDRACYIRSNSYGKSLEDWPTDVLIDFTIALRDKQNIKQTRPDLLTFKDPPIEG